MQVKVEPVGEFELKGIRRPRRRTMWLLLYRRLRGSQLVFVARAVEYDGHEILIFRK